MKGKTNALVHAANTICSNMELDKILQSLIEQINEVVEQTDVIFIFLFDELMQVLVPFLSYGLEEKFFFRMTMKPGESIAGEVFQTKKSMLCRIRENAQQAMCSITDENLKNYRASVPGGGYPESAICSPILYRDKCLGVLTINRFIKDKPYTNEDRELLESISSMAAVAIANAKLYSQATENLRKMHELNNIITAKSEQLSHALEVNKILAMISLTGQGIKKMCEAMSENLSAPVVIMDELGYIITSCATENQPISDYSSKLQTSILNGNLDMKTLRDSIDSDSIYLYPVSDGSNYIGYILVINTNLDQSLVKLVCDIASILLAIEILRVDREKQVVEDSFASSLADLLRGDNIENAINKLRMINPEISSGKYVVSVVQITIQEGISNHRRVYLMRSDVIRQIKSNYSKCVCMVQEECVILLHIFCKSLAEDEIYKHINNQQNRLQEQYGNKGLIIKSGTGQIVQHLSAIPRSFADAKLALTYTNYRENRQFHQFYPELGMRKLFIRNTPEELYQYYCDVVGPVKQYDYAHGTELMKTLRIYVTNNQSISKSAKALFVHENTIHYRVNRIKDLLCFGESDSYWHEVKVAMEIEEYLKELRFSL